MTSTDLVISFSFDVWLKVNSLSSQIRNDFIGNFRQKLLTADINEKIEVIANNKSKTILTFIDKKDYIVLACLLFTKEHNIIIKLIDFLTEEQHINQEKNVINGFNVNNKIIRLTINFLDDNKNIETLFDHISSVKKTDLAINDNDFWCYFPNDNQPNDLQILSNQQYKIIQQKPALPVLLTGNYGTGKTTIAIYSALKQADILSKKGEAQILYVTENKFLAKETKKITNNISLVENINFYYYISLTKLLLEKYPLVFTQKFLSQRQITLYKFTEQFFKIQKIFIIKPEELWDEIRQTIKGSIKALKNNNGLISLNEYLAIKNQSLLPLNTDLKYIYSLAVEYQNWLETEKYWDELDLTRYLLNKFPDNYIGEYEAIYIDEIHKFTELQIDFILKLLKSTPENRNFPQIFLVGNNEANLTDKSLIWKKIKKILVESYHKLPQWKQIRELIELQELNSNFIYSDNIVNLGSIVANLSGKNRQNYSWQKSQSKPLIISEITSEFLRLKSHLNINSAILVFDDEERHKLTAIFPDDSERILLFDQISNLEFEQVLVWKMFAKIALLKENKQLNDDEVENLKYSYIYSCTNMAKKNLYFYDEKIDKIWSFSSISDYIDLGYETELESLFTDKYSDAEINLIAESYLKKSHDKAYKIATQIYQRHHNIIGVAKVEALLEEEKGNWGKAGDIWNKLGIFDEAIDCWNEVDKKLWLAKWGVLSPEDWQKRGNYFEEEKDYKLAKFCYEKAKDFDGRLRCLEKDNLWELAGDECQSKNLTLQADKYYELANKYYHDHDLIKSAIKMWTKLDKWDKVALIWEDLQQWEKAGNCWQKQGEVEKAALCWQKAQKWTSAQKCWEDLENWQELALSYESEENWALAAKNWLKIAETEKAAFCYQKANQWQNAENLWRELGYWGFVAITLQQQHKWLEASSAWSLTNPHELEALCYEQCQEWEKAEKCWLEAKNWTRIILACEKQGKWQEAAESWENLGEWRKAGIAWENVQELEKAAFCYEEGEYWQSAEKCWRQLQKSDHIATVLEKQEKWQESAEIWQKLAEWEKAGNCWQNQGEIEKAALCYEKGKHWRLAEDSWEKLENWERVENACKQQGTWQTAAYEWLQVNQLEKAALCYENCQDWQKAAKYWQKSGNWERVGHAHEQLQKWQEAASAYLTANINEKAAICYEKAENWSSAEECWRKLWKWEKLAIVCEYQQKWEEAANTWLLINEIEKAAICYEKCQNWEKAEECWRKLSNWEKLATVCEYLEKWEEAAQLWQYLEKWEKAALVCVKIDDLETAVKYYQKGGYIQQAEECRQKISD